MEIGWVTKKPSWREKLEALIDDVLSKQPPDFDALLKELEAAKCEVKRGKHIALRLEGQHRFIRLQSLSDDYSEAAIRERIFRKEVPVISSTCTD